MRVSGGKVRETPVGEDYNTATFLCQCGGLLQVQTLKQYNLSSSVYHPL